MEGSRTCTPSSSITYSLVEAFEQESWVPHHIVVLYINIANSDKTLKGVDLLGFQA